MSAAQDSWLVSNSGTGTVTFASLVSAGQDVLPKGGTYEFVVNAGTWSSGSVVLQRLAGDNTTWVAASTLGTANAVGTVTLSRRPYRIVISAATGVYVDISRVRSAE